jgi:lipopolysaccharide biosynthesis protein
LHRDEACADAIGWQTDVSSQEKLDLSLIERSGLFDREWYGKQRPGLDEAGLNPIVHYLRHGARLGFNPNPLFESEWYLAQFSENPDSTINPLIHYLVRGIKEDRDPNPYFDARWYLANNPEIARTAQGAFAHYLWHGSAQHRDPGPFFETSWYLEQNPELQADDVNPLVHYLEFGWRKGRLPCDPHRLLREVKVAVVVHLFYADGWEEIAWWLHNIPVDFDLFVSVPVDNAHALRSLVTGDYPRATVIEVRNLGRDIGPFFSILPSVLAGSYTAICKLHTKKGPTEPHTWRFLLLRGLLANKMLVTRILHAFASQPELALIGPREVYLSGPAFIMQNKKTIARILRDLYRTSGIPKEWGFFAGTMFWARPEFFKIFARIGAGAFCFEDDNSKNDGQLAHAMERVFGAMATIERKQIGLTNVTDFSPLDGTVHITSAPAHPRKEGFVSALSEQVPAFHRQLLLAGYPQPLRWRAPNPIIRRNKFLGFGLKLAYRLRWELTRSRYRELVEASHLFDREWYLNCYPDVRAAGLDPALHYLRRGAMEARNPGPLFDTAWYLSQYPHVAAAGVNPLVHYLRHGWRSGYRRRASEVIAGEVSDATLVCRKRPVPRGQVALLVTYAPDGRLKPQVRRYLETLRSDGLQTILIVAADKPFQEEDASLLDHLEGLYVRENVGYDFAAWAHILREQPQLFSVEVLYLLTDSVFEGLDDQQFADLLQKLRSAASDIVGITESFRRGWYIRCDFIALKSRALSCVALRTFFSNVKSLCERQDVLRAYEMHFARRMQGAGLSCEVLFPGASGARR